MGEGRTHASMGTPPPTTTRRSLGVVWLQASVTDLWDHGREGWAIWEDPAGGVRGIRGIFFPVRTSPTYLLESTLLSRYYSVGTNQCTMHTHAPDGMIWGKLFSSFLIFIGFLSCWVIFDQYPYPMYLSPWQRYLPLGTYCVIRSPIPPSMPGTEGNPAQSLPWSLRAPSIRQP
ncbi:hypothetical protein BO94DRAFT_30260 [Aspergillus sclerotioniger CBS 115572]|uniref:Uncharacterized protein n=1 Tax=Aspergillus sclerotioniger CBS 115572 TaxID=1450535 RepID=A0A317WW18_9EURO|nr:hypothetical protein BO94DRAFT_30260 [Aspergillus sclerotioniger CBS 115572]PWY90559.1 hypothetical protein BO94DRAFT_30260 [Aspergillus sclerotioniger CBS 115572]